VSTPAPISFTLPPEVLEEIAQRAATLVLEQLAERDGEDRWMTTREAAEYLRLSVNALHRLTAERRIPFEQDAPGARCWFRRTELDAWRCS
jgi:excisionase family DNA binding protein